MAHYSYAKGPKPIKKGSSATRSSFRSPHEKELETRIKRLTRYLARHGRDVDHRAARRLKAKLETERRTGEPAETLASPSYFEALKAADVAQLLQLFVATLATWFPTTFTVVPRNWEIPIEELPGTDIRRRLNGFRTDLYAKGARAAGGWLFAFVHGEYDGEAGTFRIHVHGLCSRSMVPVLERLREYPRYETRRYETDGTEATIFRPVRIRHKPLYNLPAPITYIVKGFWPSRPTVLMPDGRRVRIRSGRRIPEPHHSMVLLWLDQWSMQDLRMIIGLREGKRGLTVTRRTEGSS